MARRDPRLKQPRQPVRAFGQSGHAACGIGRRCRPINCKRTLRPYALTLQGGSEPQYAVTATRRIEDLLEFQQLSLQCINCSALRIDGTRSAIGLDRGA